ncbi:glycerophosphoryl diester phosphodiesterase [Sulfuriferula plumbiphila]|uniref:Glycerophosphoryl diester phosphodiesterase n=1 Tax=Sulfuriferula plumbiphila TaxID=171865 RepID=A0A512LC83_9PROT|nr:MlaD family protein [Sulfuriferula plumbiphila]BBP04071.1 glycerophosphoryl diester phosphodiesterase [Sulfuriferula plumbiphila]GEP32085.1 glycerophosphoryl diester phosphodiesterase [Sulfuriferula plumbiphila]
MNKSMQFKVGLFVISAVLVTTTFFVYLLYARGYFERTWHYTLAASSAEGIGVGTPLTFRGIAIGQVANVALTDQGLVHITISVPGRERRWLRRNSRFAVERPLVGAARIRVDLTDLSSPALANGAAVPLDMGSAAVDVPALAAKVNGILDQLAGVSKNVAYITRKNGEIDAALVNVKTVTTRMSGKYGMAQGLLGSERNAQVLMDALNNARKLTANLDALSQKMDHWAFSRGGMADKADQSLAQIQAMLGDLRVSLNKLDAILANVNGLTANLKDGTDDLGQLRGQVDEAVSKANQLITKINRILPSSEPGKVKLP